MCLSVIVFLTSKKNQQTQLGFKRIIDRMTMMLYYVWSEKGSLTCCSSVPGSRKVTRSREKWPRMCRSWQTLPICMQIEYSTLGQTELCGTEQPDAWKNPDPCSWSPEESMHTPPPGSTSRSTVMQVTLFEGGWASITPPKKWQKPLQTDMLKAQ